MSRGGPRGGPDPAHERARRRGRRRRLATHDPPGQVKSEINVTPFVDVVLVLLIIFMVVTPLLQRGKDVPLPITRHHGERQDNGEQILLSVTLDGAVYLGQERVDLRTLEARLRRLLTRKPPPPVFVRGDRRLTFAPVRKVLEAVHGAGAPGVSLATQPRKEGG